MNTPLERLEISRLASFTVLDPDPQKFPSEEGWVRMHPGWINVAMRSQTKLANYLSRIGIKTNVYVLSQHPENVFDIFLMLDRWHPVFFGALGIKNDPSAINLLITNESYGTPNAMPPTAWTILHMVCQTLYDFQDTTGKKYINLWENLLKGVYAKDIKMRNTVGIMESLFTFRSARTKNLNDPHEGLVDLMVDSLIHEKISRNEFPVFSGLNPVDEADQLWDVFEREFSKQAFLDFRWMKGWYVTV